MQKIYPLLLAIFSFFAPGVYSQVNYNFSAASGTYAAITGTAVTFTATNYDAGSGGLDEGYANNIPLGFTFNYNGTNITSVNVTSNGFIYLGATFTATSQIYANNLASGFATSRPIIAPLWDDLLVASVQYTTSGSAPNRVFTMEWLNANWDYSALAPSVSFQAKFYETTNVIEFVYRAEAAAPTAPSASIGITGSGTGPGNYLSLNNSSAAPTASSSAETTTIATSPATGQIYRFTPFSGCSGTPTAGTATSPASSCNNTNFSLTLTGYSAAAGITIQWQKSAVGANSWTNIPGATAPVSQVNQAAPTDYRALVTCTNSALSATSNTVTVTQSTTNCPPTCTNNIAPANGATNVVYQPSIALSWSAATGATSYDVYFGTTNTPPLLGNATSTAVNITGGLPNTVYYWYVVPKNANGGQGTCNSNMTSFTTGAPAAPPVNDECTTATSLSPYNGTMNGTTISGTASAGLPLCATDPGTPDEDVWYKFTALQNGDATIVVVGGSTFDAVLQAFSGTCGSLTQMGTCTDATASGGTETMTLTGLVAGQTYYLRLYDYTAGAGDNFTITASGVALPIALSDFRGVRQGGRNSLSWTTQTEQNNTGFELQRSADGKNFSSLTFVTSKANNGTSSSSLQYTFDDMKPLAGTNYYRLKQIDKDGKSMLSNIVSLKGEKATSIQLVSVYPNPALNFLNVVVTSPAAERISFVVTDLAGKTIMQQGKQLVVGDNNLALGVQSLPSGSYFIKAVCSTGCETAVQKFVKQ